MFISPVTALPYLKSGKLKALGVFVSHRISVLRDLPTLDEAGAPNFDIGIWVQMPEVRSRLDEMGYTPMGGTPEALAKRIEKDSATYRKLIQDAKIRLD
ncbi:hypothetical protein CNECB9_3480096 [Cupriavidus necator]|uniref:Extra-cytoplasmic solute receptor n=1 Tax=Cupriavidus necator TaxID=106590 RepID=A0A1K0II76_CUPNE|nr:hypothetical protein CNECB9_3480096 [Cupriavidus necator]